MKNQPKKNRLFFHLTGTDCDGYRWQEVRAFRTPAQFRRWHKNWVQWLDGPAWLEPITREEYNQYFEPLF